MRNLNRACYHFQRINDPRSHEILDSSRLNVVSEVWPAGLGLRHYLARVDSRRN